MSAELVSVVIPAYNAVATLDDTLRSVRAQTHEALEIIVVDDGSRDETAELARRHAAADARVRVVEQANAGVAAARNTGWAQARSDFIAFVDADDLWHATKIERQLAALKADPAAGLAYCWYKVIDADDNIIDESDTNRWAGDVFDRLCVSNFIGNGSAVLVRRAALEHAGGFESGLRAAGAQGCEDYLFALRVAEKYAFAVVPDYLVGYRHLPDNMSSNMARMLRSWMLAVDEMKARHPDKARLLMKGLVFYVTWLLHKALYGRPDQIRPVLAQAYAYDPMLAGRAVALNVRSTAGIAVRGTLRLVMRRTTGAEAQQGRFAVGEPRSC